jgi:hypothetical protein
MRAVAAETLLSHWERGPGRTPAARACELLRAVAADAGEDERPWSEWGRDAGAWPLGRRDAGLLSLHAATFGAVLEGVTACPACGGQAELELDATLLASAGSPPSTVTVHAAGHVVRCHLPTTAELAAVSVAAVPAAGGVGPDATAAADALFAACVDDATTDGRPVEVADLPPETREAVEEALAAADAAAETRLVVDCPTCGEVWNAAFDPAAFVCTEMDRAALELAREVHTLARAYGWAERDILAMRPARRRLYLEVAR